MRLGPASDRGPESVGGGLADDARGATRRLLLFVPTRKRRCPAPRGPFGRVLWVLIGMPLPPPRDWVDEDTRQRSMVAMLASSWRAPAAGSRLLSLSICASVSSIASAAVFSSTRATRRVPGI